MASGHIDPVCHMTVEPATAAGGQVSAYLQDSLLDGFTPRGTDLVTAGTGPATTQVVPGIAVVATDVDAADAGALRLLVPGDRDATASVRLLGPDGDVPLPGAQDLDLPAGEVTDVSLGGLAAGSYTAVVESTEAVVAGAMIAREELAQKWRPGSHGNTYGGNGLTCAVTHELLCLVEEELAANAAVVGLQLKAGLEDLQPRFAQIGSVRGRGLMIGVELIDPATGAGDHDLAEAVMEEAFRKGLLVLTCGHSTVRFCPPLTLSAEQADEAVERFALALEACIAR